MLPVKDTAMYYVPREYLQAICKKTELFIYCIYLLYFELLSQAKVKKRSKNNVSQYLCQWINNVLQENTTIYCCTDYLYFFILMFAHSGTLLGSELFIQWQSKFWLKCQLLNLYIYIYIYKIALNCLQYSNESLLLTLFINNTVTMFLRGSTTLY